MPSDKSINTCRNTCRKACCNNKKNVGAKWANSLDKCKTINPCKNAKPTQPIISNNESSKIIKSRISQHSHRGWRRVSWSRFKLEQQTKSFKTKIIGKSDLFYPGTTRCGINPVVNNLTPDEIKNIPTSSLSKSQVTCNSYPEVVKPSDTTRIINYETIEDIFIK